MKQLGDFILALRSEYRRSRKQLTTDAGKAVGKEETSFTVVTEGESASWRSHSGNSGEQSQEAEEATYD